MTSFQDPPVAHRDNLKRVQDVRLLELPRFARDDGEIVVAQAAAHVPFSIARMFTLTAPRNALRGEHAHRRCSQLLLCVHGEVEVVCDDAAATKNFVLNQNNLALWVPPTLWNTVIFKEDRSVVVVLCDRPFEEADYLRDYRDFLAFRGLAKA